MGNFKKATCVLFAVSFVFAAGCASQGGGNGGGKYNGTLAVSVANADDKILQSYDTSTKAGAALKADFESRYQSEVKITAYKNEYESKQLILNSTTDISAYDIGVSDLKCGDYIISKSNFEISHEYYHKVDTIYENESEMIAGMYPDALIPFADAQRLKMNSVKAGENQGVYITLYVPENTAAGVYTGEITVSAEGTEQKRVPVSVNVLDYTLSGSVTMKSCIPQQIMYFFNGELDDTAEMYDKYSAALKKYRLAVQYLSSYLCASEADEEKLAFVLNDEVTRAAEAAKDVRVSGYAIRVYEKWNESRGKYILNETMFLKYLKAYVDGSVSSGEDLFKKAYVYMGNIIDEPVLGGEQGIENANYVSGQFESVLAEAVEYAKQKGLESGALESLKKLPHVVTGEYVESLTGPQAYCPTIEKLNNDAEVKRYESLREEGKSYWWYTCTQPKIPYPTYHIDDNGVSARVMSWMAKEYKVDGYLTWEDAFYRTVEGDNYIDCKGKDCYDNVHRWSDAYGDGFLFYPGSPLGIDGPVASLRLSVIRDGMEENEALCDLERAYAALGEKYGARLDCGGVQNELYAKLYDTVKVKCTSDDLDECHALLGKLNELANRGVAVSDLKIGQNGEVSAKIYAQNGAQVKLNGETLAFAASGEGAVANVSGKYEKFVLTVNDTEYKIAVPQSANTYEIKAADVSVYDENQTLKTSSGTQTEKEGISAIAAEAENRYRLSLNVSALDQTLKSGSLIVYVYSDCSATVSVSVQGNNKNRFLNTFAVTSGWNVLRVDRLQDYSLSALKNVEFVNLSVLSEQAVNFAVSRVTVLK